MGKTAAFVVWAFVCVGLCVASPARGMPAKPDKLAAHDPSAGLVGALTLDQHIARRVTSGELDDAAGKRARSLVVSELELAHSLALKAAGARKLAKDAASAAELIRIDQILIGLIKDLKASHALAPKLSAKAKPTAKPKPTSDPYVGLDAKLSSLNAAATAVAIKYDKELKVKALAVVLGQAIDHQLIPKKNAPASAQIVGSDWIIGENGIAAYLAKSASAIPQAKAASAKLAGARTAFRASDANLGSFQQAHESIIGILIGL